MDLIAKWILGAVERWADGYWMLRETGIACDGGRFDALLVPVSQRAHCMKSKSQTERRDEGGVWDGFFSRPRLAAVEVKITRADFQAGFRKGQYERYDSCVGGIYLATPKGLCRSSEIPDGIGHLVAHDSGHKMSVACQRHPTYMDPPMPPDVPWRLLFALRDKSIRDRQETWAAQQRRDKDLGDIVGQFVAAPVKRLMRRLDEQAPEMLNAKEGA